MTPKRISSRLFGTKLVFIIIGITTTVPSFFKIKYGFATAGDYVIMLIGLAIAIYGVYSLVKPVRVRFDEQFMYVSRGKAVEQIPLEQVYKIKLTMTTIGSFRYVWKIGYLNTDLEHKSVRLIPRPLNRNFKEFKELVRQKNPDVLIKNWSHNFDLDQ